MGNLLRGGGGSGRAVVCSMANWSGIIMSSVVVGMMLYCACLYLHRLTITTP